MRRNIKVWILKNGQAKNMCRYSVCVCVGSTIAKVSNKTNEHTKLNWRDTTMKAHDDFIIFRVFEYTIRVYRFWLSNGYPLTCCACDHCFIAAAAAVVQTIQSSVIAFAAQKFHIVFNMYVVESVQWRTLMRTKQAHRPRRRWQQSRKNCSFGDDRIRIVMCDHFGGHSTLYTIL